MILHSGLSGVLCLTAGAVGGHTVVRVAGGCVATGVAGGYLVARVATKLHSKGVQMSEMLHFGGVNVGKVAQPCRSRFPIV